MQLTRPSDKRQRWNFPQLTAAKMIAIVSLDLTRVAALTRDQRPRL
jgi:hypothetical protein